MKDWLIEDDETFVQNMVKDGAMIVSIYYISLSCYIFAKDVTKDKTTFKPSFRNELKDLMKELFGDEEKLYNYFKSLHEQAKPKELTTGSEDKLIIPKEKPKNQFTHVTTSGKQSDEKKEENNVTISGKTKSMLSIADIKCPVIAPYISVLEKMQRPKSLSAHTRDNAKTSKCMKWVFTYVHPCLLC